MSLPLVLSLVWLAIANVIGMIPSRHKHWPQAYVLIAIGIPILGLVTYQNGPLVGLAVLIAGASILRWPLIYLWRWLRRRGARSRP